jgi:hypothetical protein
MTQKTETCAFKIPVTTNTIRTEDYESSWVQTYYLDSSLLIRGCQMGRITVLGQLMGHFKHDTL